jgi:mono/diheme cytochrome c family protein
MIMTRDDATTGYYSGKINQTLVDKAPIVVTDAVLKNGQERYNIYCSVCHGQTGKGDGMVVQRGYLMPPNLSDARLIDSPDGHLYDVIANGIRNMPAYGSKIPVADRWAIVTYIRALQRVNNATLNDVPASHRDKLK